MQGLLVLNCDYLKVFSGSSEHFFLLNWYWHKLPQFPNTVLVN